MKAEIITIGDEILIGQIVDTNSAWIAQRLGALHIDVVQISSVSDTSEAIQRAFELAAGRADLILSTGGLGPTKDDLTKQTLAAYFNTTLRRDQHVLQHVEAIFNKLNRPMLEINTQQADVLANAEVLHNETGTAPGMWIEAQERIYVVMPGVPQEMKYLMEHEVLPRLRQLPGQHTIIHRTLLTAGIGESFLAERLRVFENQLPRTIQLAYLPQYGQVKLRLTAVGDDTTMLNRQMMGQFEQLQQLVAPHLVGVGDILLEQHILDIMGSAELSLSVAESCTGGYLSHLLTRLPGSSQVFKGGGVVYSNALKMRLLDVTEETLATHGAVSEAVAVAMAQGAQRNFETDYSIAITGIAGPAGGTDEKPVGTVWIAIAGKKGVQAKKFTFGKIRVPNIERAAANALVMLHHLLKLEISVSQ